MARLNDCCALALFLLLALSPGANAQGKGEQTLTATMAKAAVKTAQDAAAALCVKVDAGTATADEMNTIRTQKKVVYDTLVADFKAAAAAETDAAVKAILSGAETANGTYNTELAATANDAEQNPCDYV